MSTSTSNLKTRERFYPNGTRKLLKYSLNGKPEGEYKKWYEDGRIKVTATFRNGGLEGPRRKYYPDSTLKAVSNYVNGALDGDVEEYFPNGQLKQVTAYEKGKKSGSATWLEDGTLVKRTIGWGMYSSEDDSRVDKLLGKLKDDSDDMAKIVGRMFPSLSDDSDNSARTSWNKQRLSQLFSALN
jgi:hypothetical protein